MDNRTACIVMGVILIAVGVLVTPLFCGAGFLLLLIVVLNWVREDWAREYIFSREAVRVARGSVG